MDQQSLAVILRQFCYGKISFIVLIPRTVSKLSGMEKRKTCLFVPLEIFEEIGEVSRALNDPVIEQRIIRKLSSLPHFIFYQGNFLSEWQKYFVL